MAKKKTAVRKLTSNKAKAAGKASPKKKAIAKGRTVVAKKTTTSKVKTATGKARTAKAGAPNKVSKPAARPVKAIKTVKVSVAKGKKSAPVKKAVAKTAVKTTKVSKGAARPMTKKAPAKVAKKTVPSSKKATPPTKKATPPAKRSAAPLKKVGKSPAKKQASPVVSKTIAPTKPASAKVSKATAGTPAALAKKGPEAGSKPATKAAAPPVMAVVPPKAVAKVAEGPKRPAKERVQIEFMVRSAPAVLFDLISTPSGFSEWYCSDVNMKGDQYTFIWPDEVESTTMIGRRLGEVIRFRRNDEEDENAYFEFRIRIDAMTNEVALIVTDHAWPDEVEETRNLWSSQIASLIRVLGA